MDGDNSSNLRELRSRPLCIICGRPGEAEEIAKALGIADHAHRLQGHEVSGIQGHAFYLGAFKLDSGEKLKYYITSSLRMGIQSFTIHAAVLFNILKPRFVVHAGVCAGDEHGRTKYVLTHRALPPKLPLHRADGFQDEAPGCGFWRGGYQLRRGQVRESATLRRRLPARLQPSQHKGRQHASLCRLSQPPELPLRRVCFWLGCPQRCRHHLLQDPVRGKWLHVHTIANPAYTTVF